jgi:flagellar basal-body rod protein FlgG
MYKALKTAASGMSAQQRKLDVTANNIANVNTTGYKSSRAEFQELLYEKEQAAGNPNEGGAPTGVEVGSGVKTAATLRDFSQGTLEQTGNPLDLAIEGGGFFQVRQPNGEAAYTRSGAFRIDANGQLVNADGMMLDPPIQIPEDTESVSISREGRVSVTTDGSESSFEVGTIEVSTFANPAGLEALGRGLFAATDASGTARKSIPGDDGSGELSQGFLEGSNVEVTEEMIDMIVSQRAYEVNSKVIRTADEMMRSATNIR